MLPLTPWSQVPKPTDRRPWAWGLGPEGVEPSPYRLKGGYAAITPQPQIGEGAAFPASAVNHGNLLSNKKSQGSCDTWPLESDKLDRVLQAQRIRGPFKGRLMTINPGFHPHLQRHSNLDLDFHSQPFIRRSSGIEGSGLLCY